MMKITPKYNPPQKIVLKADKLVKKFYDKNGILTLASEFDRKTGRVKKDVFMNSNGTRPVRISKYDENENLLLDSFYKADGKLIGSVDYSELGKNLDLML